MKPMTSSPVEPADLLDLKLLPAWLKEPVDAKRYADAEGEQDSERPAQHRRGAPTRRGLPARSSDRRRAGARHPVTKAGGHEVGRDRRARRQQDRRESPHREARSEISRPVSPEVTIRFLPYSPAFENVVAQIKSGSVAYSLFALARLFLEKPERYEVRLTAKAESLLYQMGENGSVSLDQEFLERNAFRFAHENFYKIDITQTDPIKGNFSNVARCRLSGTLLGPTNHHNYQPQLRTLYEQRFSRRMSFADYQRQIEIVNDPALIERWKEQARTAMTFKTVNGEPSSTFSSAAEAERHFRSNYLPGLVRSVDEVTISGVLSRRLPDRTLHHALEDAWTRETRSPSNMIQELVGRFRQAGLNVFRHRRGMLFVSPIRVRPFVHAQAEVSPSVNAILEILAAAPGTNRKELFEKLIADVAIEEVESRKLALASDLRWLISEGYLIEFNDGSLDLPRGKAKSQEAAAAAEPAPTLPNGSAGEPMEQVAAVDAPPLPSV